MSENAHARLDEIWEARGSIAVEIELLRAFVRDFPDNHVMHAVLGDRLSELSRTEEAEQCFRRAMEIGPPDYQVRVHELLGHHHRELGQFAEAERYFRSVIESKPTDAGGYIYLGAMFARIGRLDEAEALHRQGTACLSGAVDEAFLNLGYVLRAQARYAEALACFERALELDPQYKVARLAARDVRNAVKARERYAVAGTAEPAETEPEGTT